MSKKSNSCQFQGFEPSTPVSHFRNVFRMFDSNKDANLTFDEFTVATSAKDSSPAEKLAWLFDHVYDKVDEFTVMVGSSVSLLGTSARASSWGSTGVRSRARYRDSSRAGASNKQAQTFTACI